MDTTRKRFDRQPDDVFGIGSVAEQIDAAAKGLKKRVGHVACEHFQFLQRVHLFAQHVNVDRCTTCDLYRKVSRRVSFRRNQNLRVGHNPVFKIRLRKVSFRIGQVVSFLPAHFFKNGGDARAFELLGGDSAFQDIFHIIAPQFCLLDTSISIRIDFPGMNFRNQFG